jgi:hypothetical protein
MWLAVGLAFGLSTTGATAASTSFDGQGRIIAADPDQRTVTIEHAVIPGLLPATRSEFPVESVGLIQGAHPGDRIRFKLRAGDESHGLLTLVALASDAPTSAGGLDPLLLSIAIAVGLLALAGAVGLGIVLRRELQTLHRQLIALDHEAGMLRELVTDTQDGMRQIARVLEEAATILRLGYVREIQRRLVPRPSPATDASSAAGSAEPAAALVVVQRGRGELYHAVEGGAAGPGLAVMWDRRRTERRRNGRRPVGHERRAGERRGAPPETWTRLGFQVVPESSADIARTARVLRPVTGERGTPR